VVHAKTKFKGLLTPDDITSYKKRKQVAVKELVSSLRDDQITLQMIQNKYEKLDDVADAYLLSLEASRRSRAKAPKIRKQRVHKSS
jgi:tetrahydromethanopterin S-methyltransferase subunit B